MSRNLLSAVLVAVSATGVARADVPAVAVDVAPVHSLVARVMQDIGAPALIVPPGASPHGYSLRPSDAQALQDADIVFWIGSGLTPWLGDTIDTLAPDAQAVELLELSGTTELEMREGALFEAHDGHDGEDHDEDDHAGHDHGTHDPHAWLDPGNARVWLDSIAAELSTVDPENAEAYAANAAAGKTEIDALVAEIDGIVEPARGRNFIVFHDAYQYFETAFDIPASGAISLSDATRPSPARIEEIHDRVSQANVTCVMAEPQFNPDMVRTVLDGTEARSGVLDPLGSDLEPGPTLYPTLLRNLARTLADCL